MKFVPKKFQTVAIDGRQQEALQYMQPFYERILLKFEVLEK